MLRITLAVSVLLAVGVLSLGRARAADDELSQEELDRMAAAIQKDVEALRGISFKRPVAAALIDQEGFLKFAREEMAKSMPPEILQAQEAVAKMLGILPTDMDLEASIFEVLEEQVGGFYDPASEKFFLMESFGGGLAKTILAHELTHALDDQLYDLDSSFEEREGNDDALFAYKALVEGSGTALMNQWTLDAFERGELSPTELLGADIGMDSLERAPPYLWRPLLAEYLRGAAFLHRTDSVIKGQKGLPDLEDIAAAFDDPPTSSEQILHPEKYWGAERDTPRDVVFEPGTLPDRWEWLYENTLGELGLAFCTEPLEKRKGVKGVLGIFAARYTNDAVEGWGGDRYFLLGRSDARLLHVVTVWDDADEAAEFLGALQGLAGHVEAAVRELAAGTEVHGSGYRLRGAEGSATVELTIWYGARAEDVDAALERIEHRVDG